MTTFEKIHDDAILGKITGFDRVIFRGYLNRLMPEGAFQRFMSANGVLLKEFKTFVEAATSELKEHAKRVAEEAGRPFIYLGESSTKSSGFSKEDRAKSIAAEHGISEGLIAVFSTVEPCTSFAVVPDRESKKLKVIPQRRKCLHFYFYLLDREFGFMHIRLQSWFPMTIQVYINGREWLAKQLEARHIGFVRYENSFLQIDDLPAATLLTRKLTRRSWPRTLDALARRVNPWLDLLRTLGYDGYYWVTHQAEIATDVMFRDRASLDALLPDLFEKSMTAFAAEDVLIFLGRKMNGNFLGEVTMDRKRRPEGRRVKFRMKQNSIKMYDKGTVLRIETTINNPREFRIFRASRDDGKRRWLPMRKGVADFWHYATVGVSANERFLEALATIPATHAVVLEIDDLCRPKVCDGRRVPRLQPLREDICRLFRAILSGDHLLNGFRNSAIARQMFPKEVEDPAGRARACQRVSRLIRQLRDRGLVAKVPNRRLYRTTSLGYRLMGAAIHLRNKALPIALSSHVA